MRCRSFLNPGLVLELLSSRADAKPAEEMLNVRLDSNHDEEEREGELELRLDLSAFHRPDLCPRRREAAALAAMARTREGRERLLSHPVAQAMVAFKWQKCRLPFYFSVAYMVALAVVSTATTMRRYSTTIRWLPPGLAAPLIPATAVQVVSGCGGFLIPISFVGALALPVPSFRGCVRILFLASAIFSAVVIRDGNDYSFELSSGLLALLSWTEAFLAVYRIPSFVVHCRSVVLASSEAVKMALLVLFLFLGVLFSLHSLNYDRSPNPFPSIYNATVETSNFLFFDASCNFVSLLLMLLIFLLLLSYFIATSAIASVSIRDVFKRREEIELVQTVLELDDLEALINFPGCLAKRLCLQHVMPDSLNGLGAVVKGSEDGIFKVRAGKMQN